MTDVRRWLLAVVAGLALGGVVACGGAPEAVPAAAPSLSSSPTPASPTPAPSEPADQGPQPLPRSADVDVTSITVDAIGLRTTGLEELALLDDQTLGSPEDPDQAGWYAGGVVPGQTGPAVIAGHVDSTTGPAVFARLGELKRGETITVGLGDGTSTTFEVDRVVRTAKDAFPTDAVYGPTPDAQLRLITCSGPYVGERGYTDNTVVFATATP